jgi:hypothetical protein
MCQHEEWVNNCCMGNQDNVALCTNKRSKRRVSEVSKRVYLFTRARARARKHEFVLADADGNTRKQTRDIRTPET